MMAANLKEMFSRVRSAFDIMATGYDGAQDNRFRRSTAFGSSPEGTEEAVVGKYDRQRLQLEGRYFRRNNPIAGAIIDRLASYAIFDGIKPQARTSDPAWNKMAEQFWNQAYAPTCDYRQQQGVDMASFQEQIITERLTVGDMGFILLKNGQLQPIESPRIATPAAFMKDPNVIDGVKRNKSGIVSGYYVCNRNANGGGIDLSSYRFIKRENFVHCWRSTRPDMVRGIPDLAPVIPNLRDYKETDANVRAKIKADAKTWAKSKKEQTIANQRQRGAYNLDEGSGVNPQRVEKVEGLRLLNMRPDEDVEAFDSNTPNAQYVEYLRESISIIAARLSLPYEFVMLVFTQGSYSAQRMALIAAHHTIKKWVNWENKVFNKRIWNWRIAKAMKDGVLPLAPLDDNGQSEWHQVEWSLPYWQEIDADKQIKGETGKWKLGADSLKSMIAQGGRDRDDVFREKAGDIAAAAKAAAAVSGVDGVDISWREIIDITTGQTMSTTDPETTKGNE